jgi:hypothetical protein
MMSARSSSGPTRRSIAPRNWATIGCACRRRWKTIVTRLGPTPRSRIRGVMASRPASRALVGVPTNAPSHNSDVRRRSAPRPRSPKLPRRHVVRYRKSLHRPWPTAIGAKRPDANAKVWPGAERRLQAIEANSALSSISNAVLASALATRRPSVDRLEQPLMTSRPMSFSCARLKRCRKSGG